jgi:hypothetical protein
MFYILELHFYTTKVMKVVVEHTLFSVSFFTRSLHQSSQILEKVIIIFRAAFTAFTTLYCLLELAWKVK